MRKLFLVILTVSVLFLGANSTASAQVASESAKNNYQLPYAGLLPDSPLYFLKALRDKIIEILISDRIKKAEFDLLSADKRLSMGIALFDKKEYQLSESTISKGENYFEDGIKNLESAKKEGREIDPILLVNYDSSTKKNREILMGLVSRSYGNVRNKLLRDLKRVNKFVDLVNRVKLDSAK